MRDDNVFRIVESHGPDSAGLSMRPVLPETAVEFQRRIRLIGETTPCASQERTSFRQLQGDESRRPHQPDFQRQHQILRKIDMVWSVTERTGMRRIAAVTALALSGLWLGS